MNSTQLKLVILYVLLVLSMASFGLIFLTLYQEKISLHEEIQTLVEDNQKLKETITELDKKIEQSNYEFERELKKVQDEGKNLKLEKELLQQENKLLENKKNELEKQNSTLQKQLEAKVNSNKAFASNASQTTNETKSSGSVTTNGTTNTTGPKVAYLTFDDGPSDNTIRILDTLKSYGITATFFVNGNSSEKSLSIYKRIHNEGHAIGNHTYSHDYAYIYKSKDNYFADHNKLATLLKNTVGYAPKITRFPGGSNNTVSHKYGPKNVTTQIADQLKSEGYVFFDWNIDSTDASVAKQTKSKIVSSVLNNAKNKNTAIILFHDSKAKTTTADALPEVIEGLKNQGFTFKSLDTSSPAPQFVYKVYK